MDLKNKPFQNVNLEDSKGSIWFNHLGRSRSNGPSLVDNSNLEDADFSTKAIHSGQYDDPITGALGTPIFQSSTFYLNENREVIEEFAIKLRQNVLDNWTWEKRSKDWLPVIL